MFPRLFHELFSRDVDPQVHHFEPDSPEHHGHQVLADVVEVSFHRAHDDLSLFLLLVLRQVRLQDLQPFVHGPGGEKDFRDKDLPGFELGPDDLHGADQAFLQDALRLHALADQFPDVGLDFFFVAVENIVLDGLEELLRHRLGSHPRRCPPERGFGEGSSRPPFQGQASPGLDDLPDAHQAVEVGVPRGRVGHTQDEALSRRDPPKEVVKVRQEFFSAGRGGQEQVGGDPAHDGQPVSPVTVVVFDLHLGHGKGADGLGHVHPRIPYEVQKPLIFPVAMAEDELPLRLHRGGGLLNPGEQLFFKIRGIGDHLIIVAPPVDRQGGGFGDDLQGLLVEGRHGFSQGPHLSLVVVVVEEKLRGVQKIFLDVMHGGRRPGQPGGAETVFPHLLFPSEERIIMRNQVDVFKETGGDPVILRLLDEVVFDPVDGDSPPPHLFAVNLAGPHHPFGGVVFDGDPLTFLLYPDSDSGREDEFENMLLQGVSPEGPVEKRVRRKLVGEIDRGGHQPPPFSPRNLVGRPSPVLRRQGPGPGIGGVPQIDPGNVGKKVRHLPPGGFQNSFFVGHRLSPSWQGLRHYRNAECGNKNLCLRKIRGSKKALASQTSSWGGARCRQLKLFFKFKAFLKIFKREKHPGTRAAFVSPFPGNNADAPSRFS